MRRNLICIVIVLLVTAACSIAKPPFEQTPAELNQTIKSAQESHPDWNARVVALARAHLGQPYALYLLGEAPFETIDAEPIWRHDKSDCVVFVEHILAYSLTDNLRDAVRILQRIRYTGGHISVVTRNHYTEADWNIHNDWLLEDITARVGGDAVTHYDLKIDRAKFFRERYKLETEHPVQTMKVDFIPIEAMKDVQPRLRDGDVVNFVYGQGTGRWVGHVGFVVIDNGTPSLLHSQAPVVRIESIDDAITRMTADRGRLKGFRFLRVRSDAMERLRQLDGDDAPIVTVPKNSPITFDDYLKQLP
jgi:hypothetical protein